VHVARKSAFVTHRHTLCSKFGCLRNQSNTPAVIQGKFVLHCTSSYPSGSRYKYLLDGLHIDTPSSTLLNFQTPPWHTAHIRILASVTYPASACLPVHLTNLLLQQCHSNQSMQISFTNRAMIYRPLSYRSQPLNSDYTSYSGASYPP